MESKLVSTLRLKNQPVAVVLTNDKPLSGTQFKEGSMGCVAAVILSAAKGRTGIFDRKTFGCPGGGVGLGLNNYWDFPIDRLLSTGGQATLPSGHVFDMKEGERFFDCPETARKWVEALPVRDVPTEYVVLKPLADVADGEQPAVVLFFVNPDQLSALITLSGFKRGTIENVTVPWGASCQSILFALTEAKRDVPRGVIGFFDISQRQRVERDILSFTVPYEMFLEMEQNVDDSFLATEPWIKLQQRQ